MHLTLRFNKENKYIKRGSLILIQISTYFARVDSIAL